MALTPCNSFLLDNSTLGNATPSDVKESHSKEDGSYGANLK